MKSELDSSIAPMGHIYASGRSGRFVSGSRLTDEIWSGLSQIEFVHRLAEFDTAQIIAKLRYLQEAIAGAGLIAALTGLSLNSGGAEFAQRFSRFGPPRPRASAAGVPQGGAQGGAPEVFASPSLQIGFAAMTLGAAPFDTVGQCAEIVLAHQLSTGALWEDIRMKGGAYGAFANSDSLEGSFSLVTYRDPNPLRSLDAFSGILKKGQSNCSGNGQSAGLTEDELEKTIIGCYAKETRPRTAAENGLTDFFRFLYGIEDGYRKRKLQRLIAASATDLAAALEALACQKAATPVIISGIKSAEQAAAALGTELRMLPA
jgi:Zn-dependent M16 (insulinase) family peptidase